MIDLDAIRKRNNERTAYEREDCSIHAARYGGHGSYDDACSNGVEADIDALLAEVARLRGQLALDDNFRDPEFGGCVPSK